MSKILLYAAILITLATAGLGYWNHQRYQIALSGKQALIQELQQKIEQMTSELPVTKSAVATETVTDDPSKKEEGDVVQARDKAIADVANMQQQLAAKDAELAQRSNDLLAKEATIQSLTEELKKATAADPASNKKKTEQAADTLKGASSAETKSDSLTNALSNSSDLNVASGEGKVVAVNKTWSFVIINLGEHNGVVTNSTMLVKRGSQVIAKVKISSVEPLTSVGDLISNSLAEGSEIQVGDQIVPESAQ